MARRGSAVSHRQQTSLLSVYLWACPTVLQLIFLLLQMKATYERPQPITGLRQIKLVGHVNMLTAKGSMLRQKRLPPQYMKHSKQTRTDSRAPERSEVCIDNLASDKRSDST